MSASTGQELLKKNAIRSICHYENDKDCHHTVLYEVTSQAIILEHK